MPSDWRLSRGTAHPGVLKSVANTGSLQFKSRLRWLLFQLRVWSWDCHQSSMLTTSYWSQARDEGHAIFVVRFVMSTHRQGSHSINMVTCGFLLVRMSLGWRSSLCQYELPRHLYPTQCIEHVNQNDHPRYNLASIQQMELPCKRVLPGVPIGHQLHLMHWMHAAGPVRHCRPVDSRLPCTEGDEPHSASPVLEKMHETFKPS